MLALSEADSGTADRGAISNGAPRRPDVVLPAGDDASGMATMLAELLRDNVKDFPGRARAARITRGSVVMTAADRDRSVTLRFLPGRVEVTDGADERAPAIVGPWLEMTKLCSGHVSPAKAILSGDLAVRRPWGPAVAGAGYALSVPRSYYGESRELHAWQVALVAGAGIGAIGVLAVVLGARHRSAAAKHRGLTTTR